jgi:hypothetical protein
MEILAWERIAGFPGFPPRKDAGFMSFAWVDFPARNLQYESVMKLESGRNLRLAQMGG